MRSTATLAIAAARIRSLRPVVFVLVLISAGAGIGVQALREPVPLLLTSLLFMSAVAIAIAYANRPPLQGPLAGVEESAPLFGRERARANAIVPGAVVLLCASAQYVGTRALGHGTVPAILFLLSAIGGITALTIALSVPLRSRWNRALYAALAIGGALLSGGLAAFVLFATRSQAAATAAALAVALPVGFVALRQYGEALARYDPLPGA